MESIVATRGKLNYSLIFGLIIIITVITFSAHVLAKEDQQGTKQEISAEKQIKQEDKKDSSEEEEDSVYIQDQMKHMMNIWGTKKEEGFFAAIKRFILGSGPHVEFNKPYEVKIDDYTGKIYLTDAVKSRVIVFKPDGHYIEQFGKDELKNPTGIDITEDKIYISNSTKKEIAVYDKEGEYIKSFGKPAHLSKKKGEEVIYRPTGLAVDEKRERVYVVDTKNHNIKVYNLEGDFIKNIGERGIKEGEFNYPVPITVDKEGKIYVGDTLNYRVQILNSDGSFIRMFGKPGKTLGHFARPKGIAIDKEGKIYVTDGYLNVVQIFSQKGEMLAFFGRPGRGNKSFQLPNGIDIDDQEKIYVVDTLTRRIQVFKTNKNKKESKDNGSNKSDKSEKESVNKNKVDE